MERLISILRKFVGRRAQVGEQTRIYHDLKISGDDAVELIDDFYIEFGIKIAIDRFSDYFPDESESLPDIVGRLFGMRTKRKVLTVGHLLEVIRKGYWIDSGPNTA